MKMYLQFCLGMCIMEHLDVLEYSGIYFDS